MVGDASRTIQVLNISNVNAGGKTVLNDGKLLHLIQKYPFLYNPRVRAYNDEDYAVWAWKHINAAFNRSYANDPSAAFSTWDLMNRWENLKPLIQCLSKAYDLEAIPQSLRTSVVRISTELENQSCNVMVKPNNYAQNILLQNMCSIANLPMERKLALEREILDLILSSEFESKQVTKLDDTVWKEVKQKSDEFLTDIGFKQVLLTSVSRQNDNKKTLEFKPLNPYSFKSNTKSKKTLGWVPLKDAHKFIEPCYVRVKRINIEDYLPLAKIIEIGKNKNLNLNNLKRESPGIFGY